MSQIAGRAEDELIGIMWFAYPDRFAVTEQWVPPVSRDLGIPNIELRLSYLLTRLLPLLGSGPGNTIFARRDAKGKFS